MRVEEKEELGFGFLERFQEGAFQRELEEASREGEREVGGCRGGGFSWLFNRDF